MNKFLEAIHDMIEIITGERPKEKTERAKGFTGASTQQWLDWANKEKPKKRKRARKKDGTFRGDDKSTPNVNEAWENE